MGVFGSNPTFLPRRYTVEGGNYGLASSTSVQSMFGVGTTLPLGVWEVYIWAVIQTGTTSHTVSLGLGGTASWTAGLARWSSAFLNVAASGTPTSAVHKHGNSLTNGTPQVISPASTVATKWLEFRSLIHIDSSGGTLIPQLQFSAAPGGTCQVQRGGFVEIKPSRLVGVWS